MLSFTSRENLNFRLAELSSALLGRARKTVRRDAAPAQARTSVGAPVTAMGMTCTQTDGPSQCGLRIAGALDFQSAPEVRSVFDSVVAAQRPLVVLELDGLTMIDSSGVGAIVSLFKRVKAGGGEVVVKGVSGQPLAICKLLKLERVFGI